MCYKNNTKIKINETTSRYLERMYYTNKSYESFICILARSYSNCKSGHLQDMIDKYRQDYQKGCIEFNLAVDKIIYETAGYHPVDYRYSFDFDRGVGELEWN